MLAPGMQWARLLRQLVFLFLVFGFLARTVSASAGDNLPEFKECIRVCEHENCREGGAGTTIALHHRLLLWTCPAECDYTCQHIVTERRLAASRPIEQFHGKWPFYRLWGMQEPCSVLFSLFNFLAHHHGLKMIKSQIPESYSLRKYYVFFGYLGLATWTSSMIFHTRDFQITEELDYFAAGASVLYGLYYTVIRIFRLDGGGRNGSLLRSWTLLCSLCYIGHVAYLKWFSWDYSYNMTANIIVGIIHNAIWTWFSYVKYRKSKRSWTIWPGLWVTWMVLAMSLEILDFPPFWGFLDAHSLWHLGTVAPTVLWYSFLVKDAQDDIGAKRLKA